MLASKFQDKSESLLSSIIGNEKFSTPEDMASKVVVPAGPEIMS